MGMSKIDFVVDIIGGIVTNARESEHGTRLVEHTVDTQLDNTEMDY